MKVIRLCVIFCEKVMQKDLKRCDKLPNKLPRNSA
nr:MAG TPA: hypothetical protein [Caudoviricetes sp.]